MNYSKDFLQKLANEKVTGEFHPFDSGDIDKVEDYIKQIVGRLKKNDSINVEPDFTNYGSGFTSYVPIRISKRNNSDSIISTENNKITKSTTGILLFVSKLTPYWYYGGSEWSITTENGKIIRSFTDYIFPEHINKYNKTQWDKDIEKIKYTLNHFNYNLLTEQELEKKIDFEIKIASNLIQGKPRVFDCFFHWED